jgi:hydroxyisourate hydrolase
MFATGLPLSLASMAMGQLTTHILDISAGLPAAGVRIDVHEAGAESSLPLASVVTGVDGRLPAPLLAGAAFRAGRYTVTFHLAEYFRARGVPLSTPAFLEEAVIRIGIANPEQHYHVPLLIAPWSYSVYRGG